jgi:hypothetical protein
VACLNNDKSIMSLPYAWCVLGISPILQTLLELLKKFAHQGPEDGHAEVAAECSKAMFMISYLISYFISYHMYI